MTFDTFYHTVVYSDASDIGGAGYTVGMRDKVACNQIEKHKSSTWK